jgi:hypothetical protein
MAKESKKSVVVSPWLLGLQSLCEYLSLQDERTAKKYFIDRGLRPRSVMGKLCWYHKDDVDKFMIKFNELPKGV